MSDKKAKAGDKVKFSPDRGNENPNGKTVLFGKVSKDNGDGTFDLQLNNGKGKRFVTQGNKLGEFKVIASVPKETIFEHGKQKNVEMISEGENDD